MLCRILDMISKVSVFMFLFCLLIMVQKHILWLFFSDLKAWGTIGIFYVYELAISTVAICLIHFFVTISSPWEKYIKMEG